MSKPFAHLAVHSDYTFSKGVSKIGDIVKQAKALKIPAIAIVDEGNMHGAMQLSEYAANAGVQPIIGVTLSLPINKKKNGNIILLAQNETGFINICHMLELAQRPRPEEGYVGGTGLASDEIIHEANHEGVICISGGKDGLLYELLRCEENDRALDTLRWLKFLFGDRFYVGISRFGDETEEEKAIENKLIELSRKDIGFACADGVERGEIPLVALSDVWYATKERYEAYELSDAVANGKKVAVTENGVISQSDRRFHIRSSETMYELFSDLPAAVENANNIAMRCAFLAGKRKPILPPFETEGGRSEAEELRVQSIEGLSERLQKFNIPETEHEKYFERLNYELGIIEKMEFPGYFLIVSDFIKWAKRNDIPVGPGRGSGAGSLVAWVLQITNINPFDYNLLFERFLNPERVSMPDFDIDFCQDRRGEVIHYVRERYGADRVSLIQTFTKVQAKTAIRDVGRVMISDKFGGYAYPETDRLSKLVSMDGANTQTIEFSLKDEKNPEFRSFVQSDPKYTVLAKEAMEYEGIFRQTSTHAAGVIISGLSLYKLVSIGYDVTSGMTVCQYNMKNAEDAGLVKFDFLGLKTLSVIKETLKNIKESTGEEIDIDLIPMDDPETFEMLAKGHSNGVFQVESEGMKKALKQIKPTKIDDLIAVGALYRPGPMEMIPLYADCKNGVKEPVYPEPVSGTKPFLEETFGILVYQEQVMQVAQVVAGYSLGGADLLRRAMGKKIKEEMDKQRVLFVEGAVKNGHSEKDAGALFDTIAKFANYGFNKSHAAAYGVISYQTAWLKRHYPAQFYAASLTYDSGDADKMSLLKDDMDADNIPMLKPDINKSYSRFKAEQLPDGRYGVRFGLKAIKNVSGDMEALIEARKDGPFTDLVNFHQRMSNEFRANQIQKLAEAGAFDSLSNNRASAVSILTWLSKGAKKSAGQADLFGGSEPIQIKKEIAEVPEWGDRADREFLAVGFYFADHPLDIFKAKFDKLNVKSKQEIIAHMKENRLENMNVRVAGLVDECVLKRSQKGAIYVDAKILERKDFMFAKFFSNRDSEAGYIENIETILKNAKVGRRPVIIEAQAKINEQFGGLSIFGRRILDAETLVAQERGKMVVTLDQDAIKFSVDEQKRVINIREGLANGSIKKDDEQKLMVNIKNMAMTRKAQELVEYLRTLQKDDDPKAVPIIVSIITGEVRKNRQLVGRYLVDLAAETNLKSMDGITSVQELVEE